jgi:hypothetical protein
LTPHGTAKASCKTAHDFSRQPACFFPEARIKERDFAFKTAYSLMNKIEKYRWKHRSFSFPIELKIADAVARRFKGSCKGELQPTRHAHLVLQILPFSTFLFF